MTKLIRVASLIVSVCLVLGLLCSCTGTPGPVTDPDGGETPTGQVVDYAEKLKLNMSSDTAKQQVTVKSFIDGDTTHFHVPQSVVESGVLKARYLAVNTPESTGKIEEYGKKAAQFTRERLEKATSIIIESDDTNWNLDSTGGRYLVWVWYKTADSGEYRNLNLEILQNGLAVASSSANNRYGSYCTSALSQAREQKLNVYSGEKDPDFFYGDAVELTLRELRLNVEEYVGCKVAFNGVITTNSNSSVYVESYDRETDRYYGMSVYYGYGLSGDGLDILSVGNEARIVGTVQYYELGGTYQVSGLTYRAMKPDDPNNIQKISEGHSPSYLETDASDFAEGRVTVETEEESRSFGYAQLAMGTSISMNNLKVVSINTTTNEESSQLGAMTLHCTVNGVPVTVRTAVLYDENNQLITWETYNGKTVSVKGIVDYYEGEYQIKVFTAKNIIIK